MISGPSWSTCRAMALHSQPRRLHVGSRPCAYLARRGDRSCAAGRERGRAEESDREFLLWLDGEVGAPVHVVLSKCDLVPPVELARRYTLLGAELRKLQLRHLVQPHHMISSKTNAGIDLLRSSLAAALPEKLVRRAAKHARRAGAADGSGHAHSAPTAQLDDISTPAARQFAERLEERKRHAANLKLEREQAEYAQLVTSSPALEREHRERVAHDFWAQRSRMREERWRGQRHSHRNRAAAADPHPDEPKRSSSHVLRRSVNTYL